MLDGDHAADAVLAAGPCDVLRRLLEHRVEVGGHAVQALGPDHGLAHGDLVHGARHDALRLGGGHGRDGGRRAADLGHEGGGDRAGPRRQDDAQQPDPERAGGARDSTGWRRTGSSSRAYVSQARPRATTDSRSRPSRPGSPPSARGASTRTGQCHRYQPYESRPSVRMAGAPSSVPTRVVPPVPAATTAAVPSTGSSAAVPGNGVPSSSSSAAPTTVDQARDGGGVAQPGGQGGERGGGQGEQGTDAELPAPAPRLEVGQRLARRGLPDAPREGAGHGHDGEDDERGRGGDRRPAGGTAAGGPAHPEHDQHDRDGPDEVELLLHAERPVVLVRRLGVVGEVVDPVPREQQVHREQPAPHRVPGDLADLERRQQQPRRGQRGEGHQGGQREQPSRPPGPEGPQRDRARPADLGQQQARDEEAGEHEEHVDPDVAAVDAGHPGVEQDDRHHGDGAQALDVAAVPGPGRARGRAVRAGAGRCRSGRSATGAVIAPSPAGRGARP